MKAILVGAGGMGRAWGRNVRDHFPDIDVTAWVDVAPGAAEAAIAEIGLTGARAYTDQAEAMREAGAELLIDVSVPEAHPGVTIAALEAGLDVLGEKPMAPTMAEARRMVETARRTGRTFMVSQSRRFDANLAAYRDLARGSLGDLGLLTADFFLGAHFGGFRDRMDSVLLHDMAIHTFDAARAIAGRDAISVYAEEFNPPWSWYEGASGATCLFEMEGGLRFEYRGLWSAEGAPTSWNASWRAVGGEGTALWDGEGDVRASLVTARGGFHSETREVRPEIAPAPGGIHGSLAEFLAARREGRRPLCDGRDNLGSLAMVLAAVESSRLRRRVRLDEL